MEQAGIGNALLIGGTGTMKAAAKLAVAAGTKGGGLRVAAVPDTVDNDVSGTDFCLGFGSCARYCAQVSIDVAADVRSLPTPVSIIEVMGRNAGWIAAATSLARTGSDDAPHRVYLPEVPVTRERFLSFQRCAMCS